MIFPLYHDKCYYLHLPNQSRHESDLTKGQTPQRSWAPSPRGLSQKTARRQHNVQIAPSKGSQLQLRPHLWDQGGTSQGKETGAIQPPQCPTTAHTPGNSPLVCTSFEDPKCLQLFPGKPSAHGGQETRWRRAGRGVFKTRCSWRTRGPFLLEDKKAPISSEAPSSHIRDLMQPGKELGSGQNYHHLLTGVRKGASKKVSDCL